MKFIVLIFVISVANFVKSADVDCGKATFETPLDECCKMPTLHDDKVLTGIVMEQAKTYEKQPFMLACTSIEKYFTSQKLAKDNSFDLDAISKFIESCESVPSYWKPVLLKNSKTCTEEVTKRKTEMIEALKKSDDQTVQLDFDKCNISYLAFALCTIAVDFPECPKEAWTDNAKCQKQKDLFTSCGLKTDFWKNLFLIDMKSASEGLKN